MTTRRDNAFRQANTPSGVAALSVGVIRWPESLNQLAGIDVQASRQLEQVVQVQVTAAPLDLAKERPMDAATGGQGFLAEALGLSLGTDSIAKGTGGWGDGLGHDHPNPIRPDYPCPERSCPMCSCPGRVPALLRSSRPNKEANCADRLVPTASPCSGAPSGACRVADVCARIERGCTCCRQRPPKSRIRDQ